VIDWRIAAQVADMVSGVQPAPDGAAFTAVTAPAAQSEKLVAAYTGLSVPGPLPGAEPIGRRGWIDANLNSLRTVLDPVADKLGDGLGVLRGPVTAAAGLVMAVEVGVISGLLAQRVLGQYEFPVLDPHAPARLLFVSPNLARAGEALEATPEDLLNWVALHETTHAMQFGGVPWLREHLAGMVQELLGAVTIDPSRLKLPQGGDLRSLVDRVREDGVAALVVGPERKETLDRLQAFMAVLEGYAEHVMDAAGTELISDLPRLREALARRRRDRTGLMRVLERMLGFDLKLRQYEQGKAFCDAVVAAGGIAALNRVWEVPAAMPRLDEIEKPERWMARFDGPAQLTA
jgi:coenzyme F420 biosynthesis associated uncharacterized protein